MLRFRQSNVLHMLHLCGKRNENLTLLRNYITVTCHPVVYLFLMSKFRRLYRIVARTVAFPCDANSQAKLTSNGVTIYVPFPSVRASLHRIFVEISRILVTTFDIYIIIKRYHLRQVYNNKLTLRYILCIIRHCSILSIYRYNYYIQCILIQDACIVKSKKILTDIVNGVRNIILLYEVPFFVLC